MTEGEAPHATSPGRAGERPFVVRPATPWDAPSFYRMLAAVMGEGRHLRSDRPPLSVRGYRKAFRRAWTDRDANLVAVAESRVIGHLNISREENPVTRHVASLGMAVEGAWRGRGVGSALLEEAIRWAHAFGVEKLALTVYPDNGPARALYRKFGFREEGRMTGHSKKAVGYRDEIAMGLWLIPQPDGSGDAP
jgi:RimJ/RimL family protein N-acetyltransferase